MYYSNVIYSQSFFAERFFYLFDKDGSGFINSEELMEGLTLLTNGSKLEKLHFLFQVYDVDGKKCLNLVLFKKHSNLMKKVTNG